MSKIGLAVCLALALTTVALAKPTTSSQARVKAAQVAVSEDLKDPEATRFRKVVDHWDAKGRYSRICGEFNAKNSYGAYTGYKPFLVFVTDENKVAMKILGEDEATAMAAREKCEG
ncbi:hypothetical protein [Phenylobacterium sp.]|uniref:hypothetical protein n=1 Tax=Phenylobacterium sp. TaxID=1871053 RepID=UPI001201946B|nr:hypothetical protein [Phenylobacterium sp.]THD58790.1 MAG: hypothetical protein E8A49_17500 [Phenylobacterium sp.]